MLSLKSASLEQLRVSAFKQSYVNVVSDGMTRAVQADFIIFQQGILDEYQLKLFS